VRTGEAAGLAPAHATLLWSDNGSSVNFPAANAFYPRGSFSRTGADRRGTPPALARVGTLPHQRTAARWAAPANSH